jgi:Tetracyclin repressor-like, C-terminal domain
VSELTYDHVGYDHADGHAPQRAPAEGSFWTASATGSGDVALDWEPTPGDWRAVVMNDDGSRRLTAELEFGARTSLLWWTGAAHEFEHVLAAQASEEDPPERRLAAMASGYVRFAAEQRPLFSVVFGVGLDKKHRYPELRRAYEDLQSMIAGCVAEICPGDPVAAEQLADAVEAAAHGYATLLNDQPGSPDPAEIDRAAEQAAGATLALIQGRAALLEGS